MTTQGRLERLILIMALHLGAFLAVAHPSTWTATILGFSVGAVSVRLVFDCRREENFS